MDNFKERHELSCGDQTMMYEDIRDFAQQCIENFDERCIGPDSYDARAGKLVIIYKFDGRPQVIDLEKTHSVELEPGEMAIVETYELFKIPRDVTGYIWLRGALQRQGLSFTGGGLDPGYKGRLFICLYNHGMWRVSLSYKQPIVSIRFIKMHRKTSHPYMPEGAEPICRPPEPLLIPIEGIKGPVELAKRLRAIENKCENLAAQIKDLRKDYGRLFKLLVSSVLLLALSAVSTLVTVILGIIGIF